MIETQEQKNKLRKIIEDVEGRSSFNFFREAVKQILGIYGIRSAVFIPTLKAGNVIKFGHQTLLLTKGKNIVLDSCEFGALTLEQFKECINIDNDVVLAETLAEYVAKTNYPNEKLQKIVTLLVENS